MRVSVIGFCSSPSMMGRQSFIFIARNSAFISVAAWKGICTHKACTSAPPARSFAGSRTLRCLPHLKLTPLDSISTSLQKHC